MLDRRKVLFGAAALMAAALPAMPVMASDSRLLADTLMRDYIRRHYLEGRWDGSHWNYGGRRHTPAEYGRYYEERREPKKPFGSAKPQHPQKKPGLRPAGILRRDRATTTAGMKDAKTTGGETTGTAPAD